MIGNFENLLRRLLEWSGIALVASLIVVVVLAVVLRKLGQSLQWYDEVASILLAWITFFGAATAALNRSHLGFSELVAALPRTVRLMAFVFAELVVVGFLVLLIYGFLKLLPVLRGMGLASLPEIPVWSVQLALPVGAVLFIIAQLVSARRAWDALSVNEMPAESGE